MRSTLLRLALLGVAVLLVPACRHDHWEWDDEHDRVWVTVYNDGTSPVEVVAESESAWSGNTLDDVAFVIQPGDSGQFSFSMADLGRLRVRIYELPGHFKIFDDHWDREELDDLDQRVTITVVP